MRFLPVKTIPRVCDSQLTGVNKTVLNTFLVKLNDSNARDLLMQAGCLKLCPVTVTLVNLRP